MSYLSLNFLNLNVDLPMSLYVRFGALDTLEVFLCLESTLQMINDRILYPKAKNLRKLDLGTRSLKLTWCSAEISQVVNWDLDEYAGLLYDFIMSYACTYIYLYSFPFPYQSSGRLSAVNPVNPDVNMGNHLVEAWEKVLVTSGYVDCCIHL